MTSRLKRFAVKVTELAPFLSTENIKTFTDLLAMTEAARDVSTIANDVNYGVSYGHSMSDALDMLTDAIAKLDKEATDANEVQP